MTVKARLRNPNGDIVVDVPAAPTPVPGLVVAAMPSALFTDSGDDLFAVLHVRSGVSVGNYPDPELALAAAIDFGQVYDWTAPASDIVKAMHDPVIARRLRAIGARHRRTELERTPPTSADLQDLP